MKNHLQQSFQLFVYYIKGKQGESTLCSLTNTLKEVLLENVESGFVYTRTKLSSKFQIKDRTIEERKQDHAYHAKCLGWNENHIDEAGRRLRDRVNEHTGKIVNQTLFRKLIM